MAAKCSRSGSPSWSANSCSPGATSPQSPSRRPPIPADPGPQAPPPNWTSAMADFPRTALRARGEGERPSSFAQHRLLLRLLEIAQVRRRLVLLGGHQQALAAEKIVLAADDDLV